MGANTLTENNHELNDAVRQGIDWAQSSGASSVLILPLDLPLLTTSVLEKLVKPGCQPAPAIVIAPCRHRRGTNALFLNPSSLIQPHFGPASFAAHQKLAQEAGIFAEIFNAPELAFDLDTPEDWQDLLGTELFSGQKLFASQTT
jgi:2-phospho-L-lactate guanylyltransferase